MIRFSLGVLLGMAVGDLAQSPVQAEIRAGKGKGFATKVNGKKGGRCNSGVCRISGGKGSGRNKFLKFRILIHVVRSNVWSLTPAESAM